MRTIRNTVVFDRPFKLRGMDASRPAGSYVVDTDEKMIGGLSSTAYRRVGTFIHIPMIAHGASSLEVIEVDAQELAVALRNGCQLNALNERHRT